MFLPVLEERSDSRTTGRRCFVHEFDGQFGRTGDHVMRVFTSGWKRLRSNQSTEQREIGRYVKGSDEWDTGRDFAAKTSAVN